MNVLREHDEISCTHTHACLLDILDAEDTVNELLVLEGGVCV